MCSAVELLPLRSGCCAGFDPDKHNAIQQLGAGRQSKQHLQFTRRIWNDQGAKPARGNGSSYADTGYQATWKASRAQAKTAGASCAVMPAAPSPMR